MKILAIPRSGSKTANINDITMAYSHSNYMATDASQSIN